MGKALVDQPYLVEKMPGKGGWTYVVIAEISPEDRQALGLVRVFGRIDSYEIRQYNLLPMKDGKMLLPLKKAIRDKIRKKEGDTVHVTLFADDSSVEIPDYFLVCLLDAPEAHAFFLTLSDSNKKYYLDWIEESKQMETKVNRIAKAIERLENGERFYDWPAQK